MKLRILVLVAACAAAAVAAWLLLAPRRGSPRGALLVYNGTSGDASLVEAVATAPRRRTLPCVALGTYAQRVGVHGGRLVALDTTANAITSVSLDDLRRVTLGERACEKSAPLERSTKLRVGHIPYRGVFAGERLFVSYFADNLVEEYDWNGGTPRFVREIKFPGAQNLGLSEMAVVGRTLLVTATGYHCFQRECPGGRFNPSHLYLLDIEDPARPMVDLAPAELNTCGIRALDGERVFVVNAGDVANGRSSVQRLDALRQLGPEIKLPRAAGAVSIHQVAPSLLAVLQMSGEHLFLLDADKQTLLHILRFDGNALVELPLDTATLAERSQANFQDLIADPRHADRVYLIDEKGERLLHLQIDSQERNLRLAGVTPLATEAFHSGPSWGVFLDEATPGTL